MGKDLHGFTQEQVDEFRAQYAQCLRNMKDEHGNRMVDEESVMAYTSRSDENLSYNMQYNTPQSLADIDVL